VQGRLREEALTFNIETSCACCGRLLNISMDGRLQFKLAQPEASPLIFSPDVDWENFTEPNIIHAY
jgi:hypothetical protein